jgi:hypothetical protein
MLLDRRSVQYKSIANAGILAILTFVSISIAPPLSGSEYTDHPPPQPSTQKLAYAERLLYRRELYDLRLLLEKDDSLVNHLLASGETLLSIASYRGYVNAVDTLLRVGADPNLGNPKPLLAALNGYTNLSLGISHGARSRAEYVDILIKLTQSSANFSFMVDSDTRKVSNSYFEELVSTLCARRHFDHESLTALSDAHIEFRLTKGDISLLTRAMLTAAEVGRTEPQKSAYVPDCVDALYKKIVIVDER